MKQVNIGLIGFGTVGSGVHTLLARNAELIRERTGISMEISMICDLREDEVKKAAPGIKVTGKWQDVTGSKDVDIIVELIGGIEPANTIILEALRSGKNVVTANKKLLAEQGQEIFDTAAESGVTIGFEASVGGGMPCVMALKNGLAGNRLRSVIGILNGTTNYILTMMEEEGLTFDRALKMAQDKGFAEADPTFDIEGYDAGHKIALLSMIAFNRRIDYFSIPVEGISRISDLDIAHARDMGYVIRLLGIARPVNGLLDISVHPTMLSSRHPLAAVRNEYNAVMFDGDMTDPVILYGKGAGSLPTASAIISDIARIVSVSEDTRTPVAVNGDAKYVEPANRRSRYYIRLHTEDSPGILSKISGVFGKFNISLASVIQKEVNAPSVPLIFMTHEAEEDRIINAVKEISLFDFVADSVIFIRVED